LADGFDRNVHCLVGLPFDAVDMAGTVSSVKKAVASRERCFLSTPNLNWLVGCLSDDAFRDSVINSDLSIPDGTPLIWIAKMLGVPLRERVAGSTLFETLRRGSGEKISVYFFGGPDGVAKTACDQLNRESQSFSCVGYESPGFGSIDDMSTAAIIEKINASRADFLVVALGARKGQAWIEHNLARLNVPIVSHLGAVVNFVAGTARRAPVWLQKLGLEWLWRIKEEPDLWRRYFIDGTAFLGLLATRVLPHAWFIFRNKPTRREIESGTLEVHEENSDVTIRLHGAWVQENLPRLRECIRNTAMSSRSVRLDMSNVTYVDSAFLGLLMLARARLSAMNQHLAITNLTPAALQIFKFSCARFLLDEPLPPDRAAQSRSM
jgi:N-acetylglucosaminyldiphosphoundecaprenol N-acetyl-beta-D-mannosaminyltransferase